ncbi:MAG: GxxExxY protein [Fluviicola sp.]|nr:GxxExxY protein [Fluviicola sp.]
MENGLSQRYLDELTYEINAAAIEVHRTIGPGLLESIYQKCLQQELSLRNIYFDSELNVQLNYKGVLLNSNLRCDLFVERCIVLEIKAVEAMHSIHEAQLLTYMQQLSAPKGILYNFNCSNLIRNGQKTFVNKLFAQLPTR